MRFGLTSIAALVVGLAVTSSTAQIGPLHVPPVHPRPFVAHVDLVELAHDVPATPAAPVDPSAAAPLEPGWGPIEAPFSRVSEVSSHVVPGLPLRLERADAPDLLLTFEKRDRRQFLVLLEEEDAAAGGVRPIPLGLDRSYGSPRGRAIAPLGERGPWLRIELRRP